MILKVIKNHDGDGMGESANDVNFYHKSRKSSQLSRSTIMQVNFDSEIFRVATDECAPLIQPSENTKVNDENELITAKKSYERLRGRFHNSFPPNSFH